MPREKKFKPMPGQIDYTHARWAPVINCVVRFRGTILLVKRNNGMRFYPGHWNGISGFLDDQCSLKEKVRDELQEELGISPKHITSIHFGAVFHQEAPAYKKTWIVHPVLVDVSGNNVKLDWEAKESMWIHPRDAKKFKLVPGFDRVLKSVL
ncbi:MAG: NUDIX hydrolase [Parcubacteria group bacterium Gr01-1014_70]|nr:MAG: NUDIX hydrolase [Parcubacteria group bacterium Gr01-1014_70]